MIGLVIARDANKNKTTESWGSMTWMANQPLSGSTVAVGRLALHPGFADPLHSHSNADEAIFLLRGGIRVQLGGSEVILEAGDALTVSLRGRPPEKITGTEKPKGPFPIFPVPEVHSRIKLSGIPNPFRTKRRKKPFDLYVLAGRIA